MEITDSLIAKHCNCTLNSWKHENMYWAMRQRDTVSLSHKYTSMVVPQVGDNRPIVPLAIYSRYSHQHRLQNHCRAQCCLKDKYKTWKLLPMNMYANHILAMDTFTFLDNILQIHTLYDFPHQWNLYRSELCSVFLPAVYPHQRP